MQNMKIVLAKNLGFCTGVKRALFIARNSLKNDRKPVYFLGEIIHNEEVIKEIKKEGGKIVSSPKKIKTGTLIIRAHGAPPLSDLKDILIRDATCPLVKKVQDAAKKLSEKKYQVVIIGEKKHPEIKGIQGNINNKGIVIENEKEAEELRRFKKLGVIVQTTQSWEKVKKLLGILKTKSKRLKWLNTLCPQVLSRQKELYEIIKKSAGVLIIGSKTSANTKRMAEIAKKSKNPFWLVNSVANLEHISFKNLPSLGIVSGTSAPDWEIKKIIKYLKNK